MLSSDNSDESKRVEASMNKKDKKVVHRYLSEIGRKGGRKSKRELKPEDAREMAKVREAKRAFQKYFHECFWSFDPNLEIGKADVTWIAEQLMKNGSRTCWLIGRRLCQ